MKCLVLLSLSLLAHPAQSSILSANCTARPDVAMYAPAFVSRYEFSVVLQFSAPYNLSSAACGSSYSCLLGIGKNGVFTPGSATPLSPGSTTEYSIGVAVLAAGDIDMVIRYDACSLSSIPLFVTTVANFVSPTVRGPPPEPRWSAA